MSKVSKTLIVIIVALVIVLASYYVFFHETQKERYERAYPKIMVGMSKSEVTSLIGQPDEVRCDYRPSAKCEEAFVYVTFLELWAVNFDDNGNVSGKYYNVSP